MPTRGIASNKAVWFLIGPLDSTDAVRHLPVYTLPFVIGRRQGLSLSLPSGTVSSVHAEIIQAGNAVALRDLNSTNGSYVNGKRISEPVVLHQDDLVQFANVAFRVREQSAQESLHTVQQDVCDRALALVQFDKLMADHAVTPFFQPIVRMESGETMGFEVLGRSRLFGLETPKEMFGVASQLNLEVELSTMLRWEGVEAGQALPGPPLLFLNTHPRELVEPGLAASLRALREHHPQQAMTLEIHESAVTDAAMMAELRPALTELNIALAYDDFGAGQSRLNELVEASPDYVKFDISLVHQIESASAARQQLVATLVKMVRDLGIAAVAEGVETAAENECCRQLDFDLGQGYLYGRPAPAKAFQPTA